MVKKIINWTANGFFRSLGKFLFFFLITCLIVILLGNGSVKITDLLGIDTVYASEIQSYNSTYSSIQTCTYSNDACRNATWYGNYNVGTWNEVSGMLMEWDVHIVGSTNNTFLSSRTYYVEFTLGATGDALNNTTMYNLMNNVDYIIMGGTNSNETGASRTNLSNYTCGMQQGNGTNRVVVGCTFQPRVDLKYFRVALQYSVPRFHFTEYSYYTLDHFTYDAGVEGAIANQNILIEQGFTDIQTTINNFSEDIINNQNENTQAIIEANKVCNVYDKGSISIVGKFLNTSGGEASHSEYGISEYILIHNDSIIETLVPYTNNNIASYCYYNINKTLISCTKLYDNTTFTIPSNASYFRFSIQRFVNMPQLKICNNGSQAMQDTLTDDNVDADANGMVDFLTGFEFDNDATFSNLITLPIDFITNVFLQTTTADLCVTFRGQNICLPNGKLLWDRTHTCNQEVTLCDNSVSLTAFQTLFSILVGGYLSFKMLRGLVRSFDDIIDPTIDSVEMPDVGGYQALHNNNVNRSTVYRRIITGRRSL